jgi:hypothetical protein
MLRPLLLSGLLLLTGTACAEPQGPSEATGNLRIITHSSGGSPDADGYTLTVTGQGSVAMGINDTILYTDLAIGDYTVNLGDVEGTCSVTDGAIRTPYVPIGTTTVDFYVPCP